MLPHNIREIGTKNNRLAYDEFAWKKGQGELKIRGWVPEKMANSQSHTSEIANKKSIQRTRVSCKHRK